MKGLRRLSIIVEDTGIAGQHIHLTSQDLESQVLVGLRRDVPGLKIIPHSYPYFYVSVVGVEDQFGCAFYIHVGVSRPTRILDDDSVEVAQGIAEVWGAGSGMIYTGNRDLMASKLREYLNTQITNFAADYYKQNPN